MSASWIAPLQFVRRLPEPREIRIHGVVYPSINAAKRALHCSATTVYRLIGEGYRNRERASR